MQWTTASLRRLDFMIFHIPLTVPVHCILTALLELPIASNCILNSVYMKNSMLEAWITTQNTARNIIDANLIHDQKGLQN